MAQNDFFGLRMEHILRNTLLTLIEVPGSTLLSVSRMLGDARFREHILTKVSDPVVRSFWLREFASMPPKLQAEAVSPIYNKVGQLVSNPLLCNILGQSRSTLDLRTVMDEGKVLLVNLSKGRLGEDASVLLGAFLVTAIQQAAMSRADTREQDRPDFYLFIDEFQNFAGVRWPGGGDSAAAGTHVPKCRWVTRIAKNTGNSGLFRAVTHERGGEGEATTDIAMARPMGDNG